MENQGDVQHPGARIRAEVIPTGVPVTKAAELIGVGRPALSNLLNGKASLTADMAARIEKAFNFPREELLKMQAEYDAAKAKQKVIPANTKAYVPPFLSIKARDIEDWVARNIPARSRLAVFLRTLVHSTGLGLTKVDFPGNDDAERSGWDGFVDSGEGTPWVPVGPSGWEFGTNLDIKTKADGDFDKSVKAHSKAERSKITFVFVTPRHWPGKGAWIKEKAAAKQWADVRAYDSSDLEQWLEQSLPGQAWFANEAKIPAEGVRSLDQCWSDWSYATNPPLPGALFHSAIEDAKRTISTRITKPPEGPTVIAADSTGEALAFVAQLLSEVGGADLAALRDRVLVFDKPGVLPRLAGRGQAFIAVIHSREVEVELAPFAAQMHSIVVYPRNSASSPNVMLEPSSYETFEAALKGIGKQRDEINNLANQSSRSLTVLRRLLATVPAVRMPPWAEDKQIGARLVPMMLAGTWNSRNEADKIGLSILAGERPFEEIEKEFQQLVHLNDAPVWSVDSYRGVVSKIDLLHAVAHFVTQADLKRFFEFSKLVLGEDDPSLDLPEDQRWAASMHGKTREFSDAFRKGISETLVLLAANGNNFFKARLGVDTEVDASLVVRELLKAPLSTRSLEANDRDLPTYAEAAPDEFLSILERDLKSSNPAVLGLLRPASPGILGNSPKRTGLLWALEGLSWNPETLTRASLILARLAQVEIDDNWVNKPAHSLESIFRSWMPQTAADHDTRVAVVKKIAEKFPDVGWKLCIAQFGNHFAVGDYSHKPRWRTDGYGYGEPFTTRQPILKFVREMVEMALTWEQYSVAMLSDLIDRLYDLIEKDQGRVWALVETWAESASDEEKAQLREKIRVSTLSWHAARRAKKNGKPTSVATAARGVYAALEPRDILNKHAWLFRDGWVEESADEMEEDFEKIDAMARMQRTRDLRIKALREVYVELGAAGILDMAYRGAAPWVVGDIAMEVLPAADRLVLLQLALDRRLSGEDEQRLTDGFFRSALAAIPDESERYLVLKALTSDLPPHSVAELITLAPFGKKTWELVDSQEESVQDAYWSEVIPGHVRDSADEKRETIERLLKARRPRAAFAASRFHLEEIDAPLLHRLLSEMAQGGNDKTNEYRLEHYHVEEAFKLITASSELTLEQKAVLEFAYIDALSRTWGRHQHQGIQNLERYVEAHPETYVMAVTWAYKRRDGGVDPADFQAPPGREKDLAERGYKLLEGMQRIPGHNDLGELDAQRLLKWISTVRQSCSELSRLEIADLCIGKLLSSAPAGKDGIWPCEAVRDVMEEIQSEEMMRGADSGVFNSRGVYSASGGALERQLAEKYRRWGQALQTSHPFVAGKLLLVLAHTYEAQASREDTDEKLRHRLH